jgi:hypothetical protein
LRLTGSIVDRALRCPASLLLPQSTNDDREAATEPARNRGKVIHRFLETARSVGLSEALAAVTEPQLRAVCAALDLDKLPTHLATEVAIAWNWVTRTARELGRNLGHRDYDRLGVDWSCEIPMTVDVFGWSLRANGTKIAYVGDYKTGWTRYPRPGAFGQTMIAAIAAAALLDCEDVVVELIYIDADTGDSYKVRDVVDSWQLQDFADQIQAMQEAWGPLEDAVALNGPDSIAKHEGHQCDFCKAFKMCSAKVALVRSVPDTLVKLGARPGAEGLELAPGAVSVRNAAAVWEACERIEKVCRMMRNEVRGIAYHEPVALSDGRVIDRTVTKRRKIDGKIAAVVLEKHYGREEALKAIDIECTLSSIRERVVANIPLGVKPKPVIESTKGTGLMDLLVAEIQAAGGLTVVETESCEPRQPRRLSNKK